MVRTQRGGADKPDSLQARAEARVDEILDTPAEAKLDPDAERELLKIEKAFSIA